MQRAPEIQHQNRATNSSAPVTRAPALRKLVEPIATLGLLLVVVTCTKMVHVSASQPTQVSGDHSAGAVRPNAKPRSSPEPEVDDVSSTAHRPADEVDATPAAGNAVLPKLHRAMEGLATGTISEPVRILWFGDSHTAADYLPNSVRKLLAQKVSLGGPGYVNLGIPNFRHGLARAWSEGSLELFPHPPSRRTREDDGVFGLGGTRVSLRDPSAYITAKAVLGGKPVPMTFELAYRLTSDSDVLRVTLGERRVELTPSSTSPAADGLRWEVLTAPSDATMEVRALHGKPQLFGVVLETQKAGLVIDTLGVNGARFGTFLAREEHSLALHVARRRPALFVVAYGTNEVFDPEPVERHARKLEQVIERLKQAAPAAECVVIGPTDAGKGGEATRQRVVALDAAERTTAAQKACSYFSPYELMVSEGGFDAWAHQDPPLSLSDGIHLTARGYARLGDAIYKQLLQ